MVKNNFERKKDAGHFFALRIYRRDCKKISRIFFVAGFFFLSFFHHVGFASAFTITPLRHTVVLDPGETKELPLFVINDEQQPLTISGEVDAFTIDSETGQAVFGATDEAADWVKTVGGQLRVEPGKHGELKFIISVPKDAVPGAHYLGTFAKHAAGSGTVGVGARVGALLFLHVSGSVREELVRDDFSVSTQWLFFQPPRVFLQLHNQGTIHTVPEGEIHVVNARDTVIATAPLNPEGEVVYPGNKWRQQYHFGKLPWTSIGPLTVRLQMQYGMTKQVISDQIRVWYLPTVVVGPVLLFVLTFGFFVVRRLKKYEKK